VTADGRETEETATVDSSFTALINAPLDKIDIPTWCFNLPEKKSIEPAHRPILGRIYDGA
jgi:hypothetical protein